MSMMATEAFRLLPTVGDAVTLTLERKSNFERKRDGPGHSG